MRNKYGYVSLQVNTDGSQGIYNNRDGKWLCYANSSGVQTFNGHASSDLSLSGGTMTGDISGSSCGCTMVSNDSNTVYFGPGSNYSGKTTNIRGNTVRLYAHTSGAVYLGYSGSTAVTSDENLKNIYDLDDKYFNFFMNLKPVTYIYKDKGHRNHIGFGARQVEKSLLDAGLTTEQFAGILIDKDVIITADEAGTEEDVHYDELYSLRYEEFVALNTAVIQKQQDEIKSLKREILELKNLIKNI